MEAYHTHSIVTKDHELHLPGIPFEPGQEVTITVEPAPKLPSARQFPLRGLPHEYFDPFEPAIDPDDWNMLRKAY